MDILTLQKMTGHANILKMMIYAHFASDYLNEASLCNLLKKHQYIIDIFGV